MAFTSIIQLLNHFDTEEKCIAHYEQLRWGDNPTCPHCEAEKPYKTNRGYKCRNKECHKKFTVKVGTIFENSKIPFRVWFAAVYLCTTSKKGISSVQLATQLGVTQKTAWFVLHRIREMLKDKAPQMLGKDAPVETDATFIGGKEKNRHYSKKKSQDNPELANDGTKYNAKKAVLGVIERDGKVVLKYVSGETKENMQAFIKEHVPAGSKVYTDEFKGYKHLGDKYVHETVKHSLSLYVAGDCHTNTIESFWSILKRGIYGIYHQVSDKHLEKYLNEFAARYNTRSLDPSGRFNKFLAESEIRLSYDTLIQKP